MLPELSRVELGGVDHGEGTTIVITRIERYLFEFAEKETLKINEDGSLKYSLSALRGCRNGTRCGFLKEGVQDRAG